MTKVAIERWDDDLAVKLPDEIVADLELREGDEIDFIIEDGIFFVVKKTAGAVPVPGQ